MAREQIDPAKVAAANAGRLASYSAAATGAPGSGAPKAPGAPILTATPLNGRLAVLDASAATIDASGRTDRLDLKGHLEDEWGPFLETFRQMATVSEYGNMTPILVVGPPAGPYKLICGARRVEASRELGLKVLALVRKSCTDEEAALWIQWENSHRKGYSPAEQLRMIRAGKEAGKTNAEVALSLNLSKSAIKLYNQILLRGDLAEGIESGRLTVNDALAALAGETNLAEQVRVETTLHALESQVHAAAAEPGAAENAGTVAKQKETIAALTKELEDLKAAAKPKVKKVKPNDGAAAAADEPSPAWVGFSTEKKASSRIDKARATATELAAYDAWLDAEKKWVRSKR